MKSTGFALPRVAALAVTAVLTLLLAFTWLPAMAANADDGYPDGYPKMGKSDESISGEQIRSTRGNIHTTLFPLYTQGGDKPDQHAYCIELDVSARYDIGMKVGDWDSFPGNNEFKKDKDVREKVAWIVFNSHPNVDLDSVIEATGIDGLTEKEAIAGTQAAIWTFTEKNFEFKGLTSNDKAAEKRVQALVDYLTGDANTGQAESQKPYIKANASDETGVAGSLVGPITFEASASTVEVQVTGDYPLVDENGEEVDLKKVPTGTELYIDVPEDAEAGEATVSSSISGEQLSGMLVTNAKKDQRTQTLMISRSEQVDVKAEATVKWDKAPAKPEIGTTASDKEDGDQFLPESGPATVVDVVDYKGLTPGKEYEITGELVIRDGSGEGKPTGITSSTKFTPEAADGSVELTFEVPEGELRGEVIVVFETLKLDGKEVATHADIEDENQTVYRPKIETDAYDLSDKDQELAHEGGTLRDDVAYSGLQVGQTYVLRGELMDKETGESTGIEASTEFVAEESSGIASLDFEVPADYAGDTLVAFEKLYFVKAEAEDEIGTQDEGEMPIPATPEEILIATHEDIDDARQTVTVDEKPEETVPPTTPEESETPTPKPSETPDETTPAGEQPEKPAKPDTEGGLAQTGESFPVLPLGIGIALLLAGSIALMIRSRKQAAE